MSTAQLNVLLAAILFGTTGTAQALGPESLSPVGVGSGRIVIGGALLAAIALVTGGLRDRWPWRLVLVAGLGVAVYQLAFFEAVARTGVGVGAVVAIGSGPVIAGALGRIVNGAWPDRAWVGATALATAGVATLTLGSTRGGSLSTAGIGLALLSGAGYATYTVVAKRLLDGGRSPVAVMGASFGAGALLLLPALPLAGTEWLGRPEGIALVVYLGLIPTALAYVLFARGLRRLSAAEVTTIVLAEPLTAMALGAFVLHERIGVAGAIGAGLVMAGLAILARPARRRVVQVA